LPGTGHGSDSDDDDDEEDDDCGMVNCPVGIRDG